MLLTSLAMPGQAQTVQPQAQVVDLFLTADALSPVAPTAAESQSRSIISNAATPGLGFIVPWGDFEIPHDLVMSNNAVVTFWLTSDTVAPLTNIRATIQKNGADVASGQIGTFADSASNGEKNLIRSEEQQKFVLGVPLGGSEWSAGDKLTLAFVFFGAAASDTPTDVFVVFGSTVHPSRVAIAVDDPGGLASAATAKTLYLGDGALVEDAPIATEDKARASESTGNAGTVSTIATAAAFVWGKATTTQDMVLGETTVTLWVSGSGNAVAMRGLRAFLFVGGAEVAQEQVGTSAWTYPVHVTTGGPVQNPVFRFVIGLDTDGLEVPAGTDIELRISTWSTTDSSVGQIVFLYGSVGRPASVMLLAKGGTQPAGPSLAVGSPSTQLSGEAGGKAKGVLTVANSGSGDVEVSLNATGDLSVEFEGSVPATATANSTRAFNFSVDLADAKAGDRYTVTVHAWAAGAEIGNVTYEVDVLPGSKAGQATTAGSTPSSTEGPSATQTTTEASGEQKETESSGVPGFGPAAALAALGALVAVRRRRA